MERREFVEQFWKSLLESSGGWRLVLQVILLLTIIPSVRALLGWVGKMWLFSTNEFWMILAFVFAIYVVLHTTKYMIEKDREKAKKSFYLVNLEAKTHRDTYIFLCRYKHGKSLLAGGSAPPQTDQAWRDWDKNLREELAEYCHSNFSEMYLRNTARDPDSRQNQSLQPSNYEGAVEFIWNDVLNSPLPNVFK